MVHAINPVVVLLQPVHLPPKQVDLPLEVLAPELKVLVIVEDLGVIVFVLLNVPL